MTLAVLDAPLVSREHISRGRWPRYFLKASLTVFADQIQRQYPQADLSQKTLDTQAFRARREAMGPVKIM